MKQNDYIYPEFIGLDPEEAEWRRCFRDKLDSLMRENHMSGCKLGSATGLSFNTISNYRRGQTGPSAYAIVKIAKALNCTTSDLIDFD